MQILLLKLSRLSLGLSLFSLLVPHTILDRSSQIRMRLGYRSERCYHVKYLGLAVVLKDEVTDCHIKAVSFDA